MLTNDKVRKTVESLPEKFTVDEIVEQLVILNKIEEGLKNVEEGRVYSTQQVEKELKKWLSSDFKENHPGIPWKQMAGMRDILIHDYLGIDIYSVWNTIEKNLPSLEQHLLDVK